MVGDFISLQENLDDVLLGKHVQNDHLHLPPQLSYFCSLFKM